MRSPRRLMALLLAVPSMLRRLRLIWMSKLMALLSGTELEIDIHPRVMVERGVKFRFSACKKAKIKICQNVRLQESFEVRFHGNIGYDPELYIGPLTVIHRNASFVVGGRLHLEGENEIGIGTVIRANQWVEFGKTSGTGEYVSIFDFIHVFDDEREIYQGTLVSQPVKIGRFVVLSCKSTVTPGTSLSAVTAVTPNSVVNGVHAPMVVLGGIPAKDFDKPHMLPSKANPLMEWALTWDVDKPGPNFKPLEVARHAVPDPQGYSRDSERYQDLLRRARVSAGLPAEPAPASQASQNGDTP